MATFKAIVKAKRKDGFYPVYIRVAHRRKLAYIPTDKFVRDSVLSRSGEIEDPYVLQYCSRKIIENAVSHESGKTVQDYENAYMAENQMYLSSLCEYKCADLRTESVTHLTGVHTACIQWCVRH